MAEGGFSPKATHVVKTNGTVFKHFPINCWQTLWKQQSHRHSMKSEAGGKKTKKVAVISQVAHTITCCSEMINGRTGCFQ